MRLISFCRRCCWKRCLERQCWQTQQHVRIMIRVHTNQNPAGSPHNTLNTNPEKNDTKYRDKDLFYITVKIWASALTNKIKYKHVFYWQTTPNFSNVSLFNVVVTQKVIQTLYPYKIKYKQFFFTLQWQLSQGQCWESSEIWHPVLVTIDGPSLVCLQSLATATLVGSLCMKKRESLSALLNWYQRLFWKAGSSYQNCTWVLL